MQHSYLDIDWASCQRYYDDGHSITKMMKEFNLSQSNVVSARKHGLFKVSDTDPYKNHYWRRGGDKLLSIPCEHLKNELSKKGLNFYPEYNDLEWDHRYCLDIAFVNIKLAVEVNGTQHYNEDGSLKDYYEKRHNYIESKGWKIIEFPYIFVWNDSEVDRLVSVIKEQANFDNLDYTDMIAEDMRARRERKLKKVTCPVCGCRKDKLSIMCRACHKERMNAEKQERALWRSLNMPELAPNEKSKEIKTKAAKKQTVTRTYTCPRCGISVSKHGGFCKWCALAVRYGEDNRLLKKDVDLNQVICFLENGEPFTKVAKRFGVTDNAVRKWLRAAGIDPKQFINKQEFTELTYKGVTKSINKWGIDLHISPATIRKRLKEGKTVEEALQVGKVNLNKKVKLYTIDGVQATVPQIAKMKKIPLMTLRHRLEKGLTIEEAVKPKK